jgi:hypothetical protein
LAASCQVTFFGRLLIRPHVSATPAASLASKSRGPRSHRCPHGLGQGCRGNASAACFIKNFGVSSFHGKTGKSPQKPDVWSDRVRRQHCLVRNISISGAAANGARYQDRGLLNIARHSNSASAPCVRSNPSLATAIGLGRRREKAPRPDELIRMHVPDHFRNPDAC